MTEPRASEIDDEKVEKLIQEQLRLNTRLRNLNRENLPHLNTRNQRYISVQIEGTRIRIQEIQDELKSIYRSRDRSVEKQSDNSLDKSKSLKGLEDFINLTKNMRSILHSPPPRIDIPPTSQNSPKSQSENTATVQPEQPLTSVVQEPNLASNMASSTPKEVNSYCPYNHHPNNVQKRARSTDINYDFRCHNINSTKNNSVYSAEFKITFQFSSKLRISRR